MQFFCLTAAMCPSVLDLLFDSFNGQLELIVLAGRVLKMRLFSCQPLSLSEKTTSEKTWPNFVYNFFSKCVRDILFLFKVQLSQSMLFMKVERLLVVCLRLLDSSRTSGSFRLERYLRINGFRSQTLWGLYFRSLNSCFINFLGLSLTSFKEYGSSASTGN